MHWEVAELNGAETVLSAAVDAGITTCFANPGTTEMPLVAAMDSTPGLRSVLCLFEGVCTGAADGYGRIAGVLQFFMQMCLKNKGLKRERQRDSKRKEASREPGAPRARICHGHGRHDIPNPLGRPLYAQRYQVWQRRPLRGP